MGIKKSKILAAGPVSFLLGLGFIASANTGSVLTTDLPLGSVISHPVLKSPQILFTLDGETSYVSLARAGLVDIQVILTNGSQ